MPFETIVGHDLPKQFLLRSLESGRLAHAYLFLGPDGVGKASLARAFAQMLGVQGPADLLWESCREGEKSLKIAQARELKQWASLKPWGSPWKLAVVDEAHRMTEEAQNALLKVLEEPPAQMMLILIASSAQTLQSTIVSRCQIVRFGRLSMSEIQEGLTKTLPEVDAAVRTALSRLAFGSIGRAMRLGEEGCLEWRSKLVLRLAGNDGSIDWELPEAERDLQEMSLEWIVDFCRDLWVSSQRVLGVDLLNPDLAVPLELLACRADPMEILELWSLCLRAQSLLAQSINPKLLWPVVVNRFRATFSRG